MTNSWFVPNISVIYPIYSCLKLCILYSEFEFYGAKSFMQKNSDCQGRKMSREKLPPDKGWFLIFQPNEKYLLFLISIPDLLLSRFFLLLPWFLSSGRREEGEVGGKISLVLLNWIWDLISGKKHVVHSRDIIEFHTA